MIVVSLDGLRYDYAHKYLQNLFPEQSMKMIRNTVRTWTSTPGMGQPTVVGLVSLWSGERPKNFHPNLLHHIDPKYNKNIPYEFKTKDGKDMDLIWNHIDKGYFLCNAWGKNPYANDEKFFVHMDNLPAELRPTDELGFWRDVVTLDYDLYWYHCTIMEYGFIKHGPYEQGRNPVAIPYQEWRKDKEFKRKVYMFGLNRFRFMMEMLQDMCPNETIIVTSDHGTGLEIPIPASAIDEIPIIVNRKIDLDKINYQWDVKGLLLKINENEKDKCNSTNK